MSKIYIIIIIIQNYHNKYIKYKNKYLKQKLLGGKLGECG